MAVFTKIDVLKYISLPCEHWSDECMKCDRKLRNAADLNNKNGYLF